MDDILSGDEGTVPGCELVFYRHAPKDMCMWTSRRSGVSALISYVLYIGAGLAAIGLIVTMTTPVITTLQDAQAYDQMLNELQQLDETIQDVASQGPRSTVEVTLHPGPGRVSVQGEAISWTLTTAAQPVQPGRTEQLGAVNVTATAISEDENELTINLSYHDTDRIYLTGFNGSLGQGTQTVSVSNAGTTNSSTRIELSR